jgi:outer membrane protein insertion porin family
MDIVGLVAGGGGHIQAFDGGTLRVFDHFQNNNRIIRGFKYNGIGPRDAATDDHLGGTTYFHASAEVQFPMPLIPESIGLRGAGFVDAATLYGTDLSGSGTIEGADMAWRASVGASLIWASPFGPLRVDYAVPVAKEEGDLIQNFNFGISTRF